MVKGKPARESIDKANKLTKGRNYRNISWNQCQCSCSSQIPIQDDLNYHQFLSLFHIRRRNDRVVLVIYNTENENEEVKILDTELIDEHTSVTQLPNGELFCYGCKSHGQALIIDRSYGVRVLLSGTPCISSSALYFNNNIYCFGGYNGECLALSRKFDLKNNRWINLTSLPKADSLCHSVVFNGNILISGYKNKNLWLYSIEINSFSIIPYDFCTKRKVLINVERLYLIEWHEDRFIYESEDEYHWKPISKLGKVDENCRFYSLYNKEKIYISEGSDYYQFDLKKKIVRKIN